MVGRTIAHYRILEELGRGSMGVVYRAEDERLQRTVALKFLPARASRDPVAKERFLREARAASALDHPNICTIHSIEETDDDQMFIVMAHYDGGTLRERLERGPLPAHEVVTTSIDVLRGLARAHDRGIVHRDIKPANLIVAEDGTTKILDFGLAKLAGDTVAEERVGTPELIDGSDAETRTQGIFGTPGYMSPEQLRREEPDARSDIWSLGVSIYEMATGQRPFSGESVQKTVSAVFHEDPPPLREPYPELPDALVSIIVRALAKCPDDRWTSAEEMLAALEALRLALTPGAAELSPTVAAGPSIAVLPFENMSDDRGQEYFCDGMAEEIINALTRVAGLRVVARTSAFAFKGSRADVREIGRKLGVETVLEGSVRNAGNRMRITAQLSGVGDGYHLWSESYDRQMDDVFAVQDEISQAIVETLKVRLVGAGERLVKRPTRDLVAYDLYLKGRFHWNKRSVEGLTLAIEQFEQAIAADPDFALAYAGEADAYNILGYYNALAPAASFPRARLFAARALELDDGLAEAHTSLAFATLLHEWDWNAAGQGFERALRLNPAYATAHHWYAEYLAFQGRHEEALNESQRALEVDPLSLIFNVLAGWVLYYARRYEEASDRLERTLELDSRFVPAQLWLGLARERMGRHGEALEVLQRAAALSDDSPPTLAALGRTLAAAGDPDEARRVLDRMQSPTTRAWASRYAVAGIQLALGENDAALRELEGAVAERDHWSVFLGVDPQWDPIRDEPRFRELVREVGIPG